MPSSAESDRSRPVPRVNTASLPITTPCSLAPISAPHIHHGWLSRTAYVRGTWSISLQVHRSRVEVVEVAGYQRSTWASLGSRSLFLANSTPSSVRLTRVSHMAARYCARRRAGCHVPSGRAGGGLTHLLLSQVAGRCQRWRNEPGNPFRREEPYVLTAPE